MNDRYVVAFFEERIYNTSLAAKAALAHRLQGRTAFKIQRLPGAPNGNRGLERCLSLGF